MWSINSDTWKPVFRTGNGGMAPKQHSWENRVQHHAGMSPANQRGRASTLARRKRAKEASRQTWIDRLLVDTFADIREIERGGYGCN